MRALIVVDVQNDFCTGSLATQRGSEVAAKIAHYLEADLADANNYAKVVATQDCHIDPGSHFSENPDFIDSWPVHCVADTEGAAFHDALKDVEFDAIFRKGAYEAAYSGFEGTSVEGDKSLTQWLRDEKITQLDIVGIATDHCVRATTLDALKAGFDVRVLTGMCAAVDNARGDATFEEVNRAGAEIV